MVRIYTLQHVLLQPKTTPQIYPEEKPRRPHRCSMGGGINVARTIAHLGGSATAIFRRVA